MISDSHSHKKQFIIVCWLLLIFSFSSANAANQSNVGVWETHLKNVYFGDRPIEKNDELIKIEGPKRAEDPSLVPLKISTNMLQTSTNYIKTITLIIDKNPDPKAGTFHFSPMNGKAEMELRVRLDQYSYIRAIAETNNGKLYMTSRFVKGSGGCSAPAAGDLQAAKARMGRMKIRTKLHSEEATPFLSTMLRISHPNITGMQKNQQTQLYYPAHYVQEIKVKLDESTIFSAELGISISENPSFKFYLLADQRGKLTAEVRDSENKQFIQTEDITIESIENSPT